MESCGKIVKGFGVAGGDPKANGYPNGTISKQASLFEDGGVSLDTLHLATINVELDNDFLVTDWSPSFNRLLKWKKDTEERIILYPVRMKVNDDTYHGILYHVYAPSKIDNKHKTNVVELLMPFVDNLKVGDSIYISDEY